MSAKRDRAYRACRCRSEGYPSVGYFDDLINSGFNSPEPVAPPHETGMSQMEQRLLQQEIIAGDVGLEASRAMLKAARVTGT